MHLLRMGFVLLVPEQFGSKMHGKRSRNISLTFAMIANEIVLICFSVIEHTTIARDI